MFTPLKIRGVRGVMKARILILIGNVEGESLNFKVELVEKLDYCNLSEARSCCVLDYSLTLPMSFSTSVRSLQELSTLSPVMDPLR